MNTSPPVRTPLTRAPVVFRLRERVGQREDLLLDRGKVRGKLRDDRSGVGRVVRFAA
jgi:hypothetical protein